MGPGSRILVLLPNGPELIQQWLGTAWLGAILVPVNTAVHGAQLRHIVEATRPDLVVVDAPLITHLSNADIRLPYKCKIWVVGDEPFDEEIIAGAATSRLPPPGDFRRPNRCFREIMQLFFTRQVQADCPKVSCVPTTVFLVGDTYWPGAASNVGRHPFYGSAFIPYKCFEYPLAGIAAWCDVCSRNPFFGFTVLERSPEHRSERDIPSGDHGSYSSESRANA